MQCCVISPEEPFEIFVENSYLNTLSKMKNGYEDSNCSIIYIYLHIYNPADIIQKQNHRYLSPIF